MTTDTHKMHDYCYQNINMLWSGIMADVFFRSGGRHAVISPGSRSALLAIAFSMHEGIRSVPILDERSAAFFALGLARRTGEPVALICTSGTAVANYLPAVVEAYESKVPLLLLTADRPPELRQCQAGQAIDQQKIYGNYVNWHTELSLPSAELKMLKYLRQTLSHAVERSKFPASGPVHINVPFRAPLAPDRVESEKLPDREDVLALLSSVRPPQEMLTSVSGESAVLDSLCVAKRGLILVGPQGGDVENFCDDIAEISNVLGWAVLDGGLSGVRNHASKVPSLVSHYDVLLRDDSFAESMKPDFVLCIGSLPISKVLRSWLESADPHLCFLEPSERSVDGLHGRSSHLRMQVCAFKQLVKDIRTEKNTTYLDDWTVADQKLGLSIDEKMEGCEFLFEGKVSWLMSRVLPANASVFVSSSMPVRDVESFWRPNEMQSKVYSNRGANGIDGVFSTAMGVACDLSTPTYLLTGDLALLHDTNAFLTAKDFGGALCVIVINNCGGGIFEKLPVSKYDIPFEEYFVMEQSVNLKTLSKAYDAKYTEALSWSDLSRILKSDVPKGVSIVEIKTDSKRDLAFREAFQCLRS